MPVISEAKRRRFTGLTGQGAQPPNQGYKASSQKTKAATGKAKFAADNTTGHLKVSFFGPFYGDYIIFDLDKTNYSRAYVSGGKDNYLWLLSRTPTITQSVRNDFLEKSKALGYDTESLISVSYTHLTLPTICSV